MPSLANGTTVILKVPQVRVLAVLLPDVGDDPPVGTVPRYHLAEAAGFVPTTGTINRVLNGIPEGSSSGDPHRGLLALGMVEKVVIDVDGVMTDSYRITKAGIRAAREWISKNTLPAKRDSKSCTNSRYTTVDD